jgi:Phosphotransferase enzyme family
LDDASWLPGNVGGALLVGGRVHRATGPWTPAVHALLEYLHPRLPHVPKAYGLDDEGREVLDYLPGYVIDLDREVLTEAQLRALVGWTRELHRLVAGFEHPGPWRHFPVADATLIGHNDIAPYNACFDGDDLAGVFDWDMAGPTTPLAELAFIAWNCVPLWRETGPADAADRLEIIAETYGGFSAGEILRAVQPRVEVMLTGIPIAAAAGDTGMQNLMAVGEPKRSRASLDALLTRLPAIAAALDHGSAGP